MTFPEPGNKPARWELKRRGFCLADGSMNESTPKFAVCKCYNCAQFIALRAAKESTQGPVPGERSDCLRCGWFVPHNMHLLDLVAQFNSLSVRLEHVYSTFLACENVLRGLKEESANAEFSGQLTGLSSYRRAERACEKERTHLCGLTEALADCLHMMDVCSAVLRYTAISKNHA